MVRPEILIQRITSFEREMQVLAGTRVACCRKRSKCTGAARSGASPSPRSCKKKAVVAREKRQLL